MTTVSMVAPSCSSNDPLDGSAAVGDRLGDAAKRGREGGVQLVTQPARQDRELEWPAVLSPEALLDLAEPVGGLGGERVA